MTAYIKSLFENHICVAASAAWGAITAFLFPETVYITATAAVLGMMTLDLITKIYALSKQAGGMRKAVKTHKINSKSFSKGTTDKLIIFGVVLIICGCSYRISPITSIATWFMQTVYALMFLRDVLSILENLNDAGVGGLGIFKRVVKKKMKEYIDDDMEDITFNVDNNAPDAGGESDNKPI